MVGMKLQRHRSEKTAELLKTTESNLNDQRHISDARALVLCPTPKIMRRYGKAKRNRSSNRNLPL